MVLRTAEVAVSGEKIKIEVYTEPENQSWGRELADWATRIMPIFYTRFGKPSGNLLIQIIEDPELPSLGWNAQKDGIRVRFPAGPEVLAEQLAHIWIHPGVISDTWLMKGVAKWESLNALRESGFGLLAMAAWQDILRTASGGAAKMDRALGSVNLYDINLPEFQFAVAKSTLFLAIVQGLLGPRVYDRWVSGVIESDKPAQAVGLKAVLNANRHQAGPLFSGWVEEGPYQRFSWTSMRDSDSDLLPDELEILIGTRPDVADTDRDGLSDGYEYWHGLSPLDRDSNGDGQSDQPLQTVAVDGLASEWQSLAGVLEYRDPSGDSSIFDLTKIRFVLSRDYIFANIETAFPPADRSEYWISLLFDLNEDRKADLLVIIDQGGQAWSVSVDDGRIVKGTGIARTGLVAHLGESFEIAVPMGLFDSHSAIAVNVRVDLPQAEGVVDHTGGYWQKIRSKSRK